MEGDAREFNELPMESAYLTLRVLGGPYRDISLEALYQRFRARMEAEESAREQRAMDIVMKMPRRKEKL